MFTLNTTAGDLIDMIRMMALPSGKEMLFDPIAPTCEPDGTISLMAQSAGSFVHARFTNKDITGLAEPTKIPIQSGKLLKYLSMYNTDTKISYLHDFDHGESQIIDRSENSIRNDTRMSTVSLSEIQSTVDKMPLKLDNKGNPLFKQGTVATSIFATLQIELFQKQIEKAELVGAEPRMFYIEYAENDIIITKVGDPHARDKDKIKTTAQAVEVIGTGRTSYALDFPEIVNNLSGIIEIATLDNGPLWIKQSTDDYSVRYLISPAVMK